MPPIQQPFVAFASSAARTANGNSDVFDLTPYVNGGLVNLLVQSDVTTVTGTTPSMTVVIEDSIDGTNWNVVGTFAAQTTANRLVIQVAISGVAQAAGFRWPFNYRKVRARWTITGTTPSFTFSIKAVPLGGSNGAK